MQTHQRWIIDDSKGLMKRAPESHAYFMWFCCVGSFILGIIVGHLWRVAQLMSAEALMR
jgi:hypothetical protein